MGKTFKVVIDQFDNQAMVDDPTAEVARMLRETASRVEYEGDLRQVDGQLSGVLKDSNGNTVGRWTFKD